jgi:hypothetical protein
VRNDDRRLAVMVITSEFSLCVSSKAAFPTLRFALNLCPPHDIQCITAFTMVTEPELAFGIVYAAAKFSTLHGIPTPESAILLGNTLVVLAAATPCSLFNQLRVWNRGGSTSWI